jgi:catechol 2,3-dioxygenase-like lactoylglutathione lyase family enzyme
MYLDHASILVPDLAQAVGQFDARLGLRVTPTPASPGSHGRLYLDRSYLEISASPTAVGWTIPCFFLRFDSPERLRLHLDAAGLRHRFSVYSGHDGQWDDVEIDAGAIPFPVLVRRTHPPDVARTWPPPLVDQHRSGALTLEAVLVTVPDLASATDAYARLVGMKPDMKTDFDLAGCPVFHLASGRIILAEGRAPGVGAIVLGAKSLAELPSTAGQHPASRIAWVDPVLSFGLRIGFVRIAGNSRPGLALP